MPLHCLFRQTLYNDDVVFIAKIMDMTFTAMPSLLMPDVQDIDMFPSVSELTVAQAAKFLDGTEGLVDELLHAGLITSRLKNGVRLIAWDSLQNYAQEENRKDAAFAEMVRENQEMGLYDVEFNLEEYNAARNAIRNENRRS